MLLWRQDEVRGKQIHPLGGIMRGSSWLPLGQTAHRCEAAPGPRLSPSLSAMTSSLYLSPEPLLMPSTGEDTQPISERLTGGGGGALQL